MFVSSADLVSLIERHFSKDTPRAVGVAVSGGSDSLALLLLVKEWAAVRGVVVYAATVDHGLRPEAKEEAQHVAELCAGMGIPHTVLTWCDWDRQGNLQAEARKARYQLLADWARELKLDEVVIGHTRDDQAETFLIRLGRKSGVEGLAAMRSHFERDGRRFGRPLLGANRADLRAYLSLRGIEWCEDASNADPTFERVRAREALVNLADLGLSAEILASVAENLASARDALDQYARTVAEACCTVDRGDVIFEAEAFFQLPDEITHRLLGTALRWISGGDYAPRSEAIAKLREALRAGQGGTLAGCIARVSSGGVRLGREAAAVKDLVTQGPEWDRWQISGPWRSGMEIRALQEADLGTMSDWRNAGLPRRSLLASPALWYDGSLISAPIAGFEQGFTARLLPNRAKLPFLNM